MAMVADKRLCAYNLTYLLVMLKKWYFITNSLLKNIYTVIPASCTEKFYSRTCIAT